MQQLHAGAQQAKKKETMYLPFDVTSPSPASDDLDGPAVGDPESPPCTRNAFSCSAVWTHFMLEAIQV